MYFKICGFVMVLMTNLACAFSGEDDVEATACLRDGYREIMTGRPEYLYRGLYRYNVNEVGEERKITIGNKTYTMITRALRPPVLEIPHFLTDSECDQIIVQAKAKGMTLSTLLGTSQWETFKSIFFSRDLQKVARVSVSTYVPMADAPDEEPVLSRIQDRLVGLTKLPRRFVESSEHMHVVKYRRGHHFHGHVDSTYYNDIGIEFPRKKFDKLPCCHLHDCKDKLLGCCVVCRYVTVMYYLSDVEEGGETAFIRAQVNKSEQSHSHLINLSYYCSNATVRIKPKKGTALLWYSNELDPKTGWLGEADPFSYHGGCDVIKGVKWIGTNWLNVPHYSYRHYKSIYRHDYVESPSIWSKIFNYKTYMHPIVQVTQSAYNAVASIKTSLMYSTVRYTNSLFSL